MWHLKNKNEQTKQKQTQRYREQTGGMGEKGERINQYKLEVTKQLQGCEVQHREYSQ